MTTITNLTSLRAMAGLNQANAKIAQASERISTGFRINRSSDDVGGMIVANNLKTQIGSFNSVLQNVSQGSAVTQTIDSALSEIVDILGYMREAAVAAESDTISDAERTAYQDEIDAYVTAIDTISTNATWNGTSLMSSETTMDIQTGVDSGSSTTLSFDKITTEELGIDNELDVETSTDTAEVAVGLIDTALDTVNTYQAYIGSMSNVMDAQYNVANNTIINYSTAYGTIMNADYAAETAALAAAQIQRDGAAAMMIQGNDLNRAFVDYLLKSVSN
jgi:flagellin